MANNKALHDSRIPMFGSRIPIPGKFRFLTGNTPQAPPPGTKTKPLNDQSTSGAAKLGNTSPEDESYSETTFIVTEKSLCAGDAGKRVSVGQYSGTLRYVGNVDFSGGEWCGIELDDAVGKHDGCVKGVRYFTCQEKCGVMAPLSKVTLQDSKNLNSTFNLIKTDYLESSGPMSLVQIDLDKSVNVSSEDEINRTVVLRSDYTFTKELSPEANRTRRTSSQSEKCSSQKRHASLELDGESPKNRRHSLLTQNCTHVKQEDPIDTTYMHVEIVESSPPLQEFNRVSNHSTPKDRMKSEINITVTKNTDSSYSSVSTPSIVKQNSFELDDSLGILTPDQMMEFSTFVENYKTPSSEDLKSLLSSKRSDKTISNSRTPSSENLGSLPQDSYKPSPLPMDIEEVSKPQVIRRPDIIELKNPIEVSQKISKMGELASPNLLENSTMEFSLGLIDEDILASANQFSSNLDTTTNLDLPLDSGKHDFKHIPRSDQTPSPEDLPLDPIDSTKNTEMDNETLEPILSNPSTESDGKSDNSKSTTNTKNNSFITSVTSITSLDTGYQGDGEMSRPASRGADHSPGAHKPNNPALINLQWQAAVSRRQDPMTDSDFFTESDADIHEENFPKGDRRAQVIDGTLYGANAQSVAPPAEIYIGNQEEMDSSGIFTDIDNNARNDDCSSDGERNKVENMIIDVKSPSDSVSSKTISEDSQEIKITTSSDANEINEHLPGLEGIHKNDKDLLKSPTSSIISNADNKKNCRTRTPLPKDEHPSKKIKIPKRNVVSKVKTMMETPKANENDQQDTRKSSRKTVSKWDAVMSKISKGQEENKVKVKLKEVKSKVSTGLIDDVGGKRLERKSGLEETAVTKSKIRRIRARPESILPGNKAVARNSSIHSSLSDVSLPSKKSLSHTVLSRVAKKRESVRCGTPMSEVLTASAAAAKSAPGAGVGVLSKIPPVTKEQPHRTAVISRDSKKTAAPLNAVTAADGKTAPGRRTLTRRNIAAVGVANTVKAPPSKDQSRVNNTTPQKGASPALPAAPAHVTVPVPAATPVPLLAPHLQHSAKGVEALGVLVQYLVFQLDAFRVPQLKHELSTVRGQWLKDNLELEETRMGYRRLEDAVADLKTARHDAVDAERVRYRAEIADIFEKHRRDIAALNEKFEEEKCDLQRISSDQQFRLRAQLTAELANKDNEITSRIEAVKSEYLQRIKELEQLHDHLKHEHRTTVEILREENESIREQLDEKVILMQDIEDLRFRNEKMKEQFREREKCFDDKLILAQDEVALLKEENKKILETFKSDTKDNKLQNGTASDSDSHLCQCGVPIPQAALGRCTQLQDEVESLRTVLDLKLAELSDLRRAHGELSQAAEELPQALLKVQSLQARVEDLELQLERKTDIENHLAKENKRLLESFHQEQKQKKRLSLHNEELQWKLKQNSEVVNVILGQTPTRKSFHDSNQSLCEDISYKTPVSGYLSRSLHTSSFNEKHLSTPHMLERTLSFRERTNSYLKDALIKKADVSEQSSKSSEYFDLEESPPSSPKVKGVVEKSDSVSWVLDMDESPEVLASRMVRRAGSFRNVTPPKLTPTKSPATKRPRTKSNNSGGPSSSIENSEESCEMDHRYRSNSESIKDLESFHPGEYLSNSWHYSLTVKNGKDLEGNPDLEHDDVAISLPALPSEINCKEGNEGTLSSLPPGDLLLLQTTFPKNSAGEALISESNSEDECTSSSSERSASVSDTETSEEPQNIDDGKCSEKFAKLQYDLYLMTESATTNSEVMDYSWSEEIDA